MLAPCRQCKHDEGQMPKFIRYWLEDFVASLVRGCVARGVKLGIERETLSPTLSPAPEHPGP